MLNVVWAVVLQHNTKQQLQQHMIYNGESTFYFHI